MEKERKICRDIVICSYYVVSFFNHNGKKLTNLQLQKLMYFLEAFYMIATDDDELYDDDFYAWAYGPVSKKLYNRYKEFGNLPIELGIDEINQGKINCKSISKYVDFLYTLFSELSASDLVTLTHSVNSPWFNISQKHNVKDLNDSKVILKEETKEWVKERILGINEEDNKS